MSCCIIPACHTLIMLDYVIKRPPPRLLHTHTRSPPTQPAFVPALDLLWTQLYYSIFFLTPWVIFIVFQLMALPQWEKNQQRNEMGGFVVTLPSTSSPLTLSVRWKEMKTTSLQGFRYCVFYKRYEAEFIFMGGWSAFWGDYGWFHTMHPCPDPSMLDPNVQFNWSEWTQQFRAHACFANWDLRPPFQAHSQPTGSMEARQWAAAS